MRKKKENTKKKTRPKKEKDLNSSKRVTRKKVEKAVTNSYVRVDSEFRSDSNKHEEFRRMLEEGQLKFAYYALEDEQPVFYYKQTLLKR